MIWHHDPIVQPVALAVEMEKGTGNKLRDIGATQVTVAVALIETTLDLATKIAADVFFGFVDRPAFLRGTPTRRSRRWRLECRSRREVFVS